MLPRVLVSVKEEVIVLTLGFQSHDEIYNASGRLVFGLCWFVAPASYRSVQITNCFQKFQNVLENVQQKF